MFRRVFSRASSTISTAHYIFSDPKSALLVATTGPTCPAPPLLHGLPEIVVTGRANVGKSTLLNAVLGRKNLLFTSKKPGRTRTLNFFRVGREPGLLVVVDAPGYGSRGRPEWGDLFARYLDHRKPLRRVYVLLNAKHGVTDTDTAMLRSLNAQAHSSASPSGPNFTLQAIITKADTLSPDSVVLAAMQRKIFDVAPFCLPAIVTSALMKPPFGIEDVRKSIADACGLLPLSSYLNSRLWSITVLQNIFKYRLCVWQYLTWIVGKGGKELVLRGTTDHPHTREITFSGELNVHLYLEA